MKKFLLPIVVVISGLFVITTVSAAEATECTAENIGSSSCSVTGELILDATDKEINVSTVRVEEGGKLTITGNSKVTLLGNVFVANGGELIIDASNVEAKTIIASVAGKLTVGPNANITYNNSGWAIYANGGSVITLNGNITAPNANIMLILAGTLGTPNITVDGAKLTAGTEKSIFEFSAQVVKGNITIIDGEFNGKVFVVRSEPSSSINEESEIVIESGKFSDLSTIKSEYLAEGSQLNEDGTVTKIELPAQPENKPEESDNNNVTSNNEANPNTADNILSNIAIGIIALTSLTGCGIYYKKRFQ